MSFVASHCTPTHTIYRIYLHPSVKRCFDKKIFSPLGVYHGEAYRYLKDGLPGVGFDRSQIPVPILGPTKTIQISFFSWKAKTVNKLTRTKCFSFSNPFCSIQEFYQAHIDNLFFEKRSRSSLGSISATIPCLSKQNVRKGLVR